MASVSRVPHWDSPPPAVDTKIPPSSEIGRAAPSAMTPSDMLSTIARCCACRFRRTARLLIHKLLGRLPGPVHLDALDPEELVDLLLRELMKAVLVYQHAYDSDESAVAVHLVLLE